MLLLMTELYEEESDLDPTIKLGLFGSSIVQPSSYKHKQTF